MNAEQAAWIVALAGGALHAWEVSCYHHDLNTLSVTEQKVAALKTENAFYYSYYEEMVSAPSARAGLHGALHDRRSEAPDTINAIYRFNIYQELLCGVLFRLARWLLGEARVPDPWYFFRGCSYALQGVGHVALLRLVAGCGGGGVRGAVLPGVSLLTMLFLHRREIGRIHDVGMLNLRENWAMPVIFCQVLALHRLLVLHPSLRGSSESTLAWRGWLWAFRLLTVACLLLWQFSAFAFLLQVSAVFLCTLLSRSVGSRRALADVVSSHIASIIVAAVLLFGNELLVHHLLLTQCVAIWVVLRLRRDPPRMRILFWVDGALAVALFGLARLVQSRWATADEHVGEIFYAKVQQLFPDLLGTEKREPTFNARLYLAVSVFDFIDWPTVMSPMLTKVYHFAGAGAVIWTWGFFLRAGVQRGDTSDRAAPSQEAQERTELVEGAYAYASSEGLRRRKPPRAGAGTGPAQDDPSDEPSDERSGDESGVEGDERGAATGGHGGPQAPSPGDYAAEAAGNAAVLFMAVLFLALGCFISRLKVLGAPLLAALAAVAAAPRPLEVLLGAAAPSGSGRCRRALRRIALLAAASAQLAQLAFLVAKLPFLEDRGFDAHREMVWADGDRGELYEWMVAHLDPDEIIITSMPLSAELRLSTPFRLAIHPQFEAQSLRDRVQELYLFYQCTPPDLMARTMEKYNSTLIVLEYRRCDFSPFMLDTHPELNCEKGGARPWKELFCPAAHTSPHFSLLFANAGFSVLRAREPKGGAAAEEPREIEDARVWRPMLERCVREAPGSCASRIAELASVFHGKLGQPKPARTLLSWVRERAGEDGQVQFLLGHHLDYDLGRSAQAGEHYRRAYELAPDNPLIVREYLMWLDVEAKDNRTLERLMRQHRFARGARPSLLDLGDPILACEASVPAFELFRDLDWAEELWQLATSRGVGSNCVRNNWPLHNDGRDMEADLYPWGVFLNVFWHRRLRSELVSTASCGVRYQEPRPPWKLGLKASFGLGG